MREAKDINFLNFKERFVGLEFENPLVTQEGGYISQDQIKEFWEKFIKDGDEKDMDYFTGALVGAKKKLSNGEFENLNTDTSVSHLEMSLAPRENLNDAEMVFYEIRDQVLDVAKAMNLRFLGYGALPAKFEGNYFDFKTKKSLYPVISLRRHNGVMTMMAHQVGVSLRPEEIVDATNAMQALAGAVTCLVANSPITDGKVTDWKETRLLNWRLAETSAMSKEERTVFPVMRDTPFTSLSDLFKYIWQGKMVLPVMRDGQWVKLKKEVSFVEYLKGKEWQGEDLFGKSVTLTPSVGDINLAVICMWHDAKPHIVFSKEKTNVTDFVANLEKNNLEEYMDGKISNCYLEYRIGATAPVGEELALPTLTLGLINNLNETRKLVEKYTWRQWKELREICYVGAMDSLLDGQSVVPVLTEMVEIANAGLIKRGFGEEKYLEVLKKRIQEKKCPADNAIETFNKGGMKEFLDFASY